MTSIVWWRQKRSGRRSPRRDRHGDTRERGESARYSAGGQNLTLGGRLGSFDVAGNRHLRRVILSDLIYWRVIPTGVEFDPPVVPPRHADEGRHPRLLLVNKDMDGAPSLTMTIRRRRACVNVNVGWYKAWLLSATMASCPVWLDQFSGINPSRLGSPSDSQKMRYPDARSKILFSVSAPCDPGADTYPPLDIRLFWASSQWRPSKNRVGFSAGHRYRRGSAR